MWGEKATENETNLTGINSPPKSIKLFLYSNRTKLPAWIIFNFSKHGDISTKAVISHFKCYKRLNVHYSTRIPCVGQSENKVKTVLGEVKQTLEL